jgi:hypothetical protein
MVRVRVSVGLRVRVSDLQVQHISVWTLGGL